MRHKIHYGDSVLQIALSNITSKVDVKYLNMLFGINYIIEMKPCYSKMANADIYFVVFTKWHCLYNGSLPTDFLLLVLKCIFINIYIMKV